jgi:hypothetical protein
LSYNNYFKIFVNFKDKSLLKTFSQLLKSDQLNKIISLKSFHNNSLNLFFIHHVTSHFFSEKLKVLKSHNETFFIVSHFSSKTQSVSQAKYQSHLSHILLKKVIKSQKISSEEIIFQLFKISHQKILNLGNFSKS